MLSQLLCSVLPAELAIEAMNKKEGKLTMTVAWERFQRQGVTKEMAVFEAKDHNQTNKAKIMCRLQRLEPFII